MLDIIDYIDKRNRELNVKKRDGKLGSQLDLLKKIALHITNNDVSGKLEEIIQLTDMCVGYSEYRVVNDCESERRELWVEYNDGDKNIRLNPGDLLIKMK